MRSSGAPVAAAPRRPLNATLGVMDVTDGSPERLALGVERFLAGEAIGSDGVVFWKDPAGFVVVYSYSEYVHPENSSAEEAGAKIERSKEVLRSLSNRSAAFKAIVESLPHKYEFCHDYGGGAIRLGWLEEGQLRWRGT